MNIFGYTITKTPKEKRRVVFTKLLNKEMRNFKLVGNAWKSHEALDFGVLLQEKLEKINSSSIKPQSLDHLVELLNIFYGDYCEFEIEK